jgi:hypothetical protein
MLGHRRVALHPARRSGKTKGRPEAAAWMSLEFVVRLR